MSRFLKYKVDGLDAYLNLDLVRTVERARDDNRRLIFWFEGNARTPIYYDTLEEADKVLNWIWSGA